MKTFTRPSFHIPTGGSDCATPVDADMIVLMGGRSYRGITITKDQSKALERFYGYDFDKARRDAEDATQRSYEKALKAHEKAERERKSWRPLDKPKKETAGGEFMVGGACRNMFRDASKEGLRIMAVLGPYLESGEDPVKFVIRMLSEAGCDVAPEHYEWAIEE